MNFFTFIVQKYALFIENIEKVPAVMAIILCFGILTGVNIGGGMRRFCSLSVLNLSIIE